MEPISFLIDPINLNDVIDVLINNCGLNGSHFEIRKSSTFIRVNLLIDPFTTTMLYMGQQLERKGIDFDLL